MSVQIKFQVTAPPFRWDEAGGIHIGQSRVTLHSLLATYHKLSTKLNLILYSLFTFQRNL